MSNKNLKNSPLIARIGSHADIEGILSLQALNLASNLSKKEQENGFVTTPFTTNQIKEIIAQDGVFVVQNEDAIIAYAFAGTWAYFEQWPIFPFMTNRFPLLNFKDWNITTTNSFQYGPVCIAMPHRGKGVLNLIFEEMRINLVTTYPLSITFINKVNQVSLKAHTKKLGWEIIDEFEFNNNTYLSLAFEMKNSVI